MACSAEINTIARWRRHMAGSRRQDSEVHDNDKCTYVMLRDAQILGKNIVMYILLRKCVCKRYANKEHLKAKRFIQLEEVGDGVEVHSDPNCQYVRKRHFDQTFHLDKVCYCERNEPL